MRAAATGTHGMAHRRSGEWRLLQLPILPGRSPAQHVCCMAPCPAGTSVTTLTVLSNLPVALVAESHRPKMGGNRVGLLLRYDPIRTPSAHPHGRAYTACTACSKRSCPSSASCLTSLRGHRQQQQQQLARQLPAPLRCQLQQQAARSRPPRLQRPQTAVAGIAPRLVTMQAQHPSRLRAPSVR